MEIEDDSKALERLSKQIADKKRPEMTELMKAHLDEVAGGLADHGSWFASKNCIG